MELNAAQVFLTKLDAISETEVVSMLERLNTSSVPFMTHWILGRLATSPSTPDHVGVIVEGLVTGLDSWDHRDPVLGTLDGELDMDQISFGSSIFEQVTARNGPYRHRLRNSIVLTIPPHQIGG